MKRIVLLYSLALLLCLFTGVVISSSYHYSWWLLFLLVIPISFGWVVLSDIFMKINETNLGKVTAITVVSFIVVMGSLMVAAYYHVNEKSFLGMIFAAGLFSYMLGICLIGVTLPKRWEEKKIRGRKNLY